MINLGWKTSRWPVHTMLEWPSYCSGLWWLNKLTQGSNFLWISACPGWRIQNLQDSVKPLDMNYSFHTISGPSSVTHSNPAPFLRMASPWLFSLKCCSLPAIPWWYTGRWRSHTFRSCLDSCGNPGSLFSYNTNANGTRKYSAKSHQEAHPTSTDTVGYGGPFCFISVDWRITWDFLWLPHRGLLQGIFSRFWPACSKSPC